MKDKRGQKWVMKNQAALGTTRQTHEQNTDEPIIREELKPDQHLT